MTDEEYHKRMTDDLIKRDLVKRYQVHREACWKALGMEECAGYSIPEEIEVLIKKNEQYRAAIERLKEENEKLRENTKRLSALTVRLC